MQPVGGCAGLHTSRKAAAQRGRVIFCSHRPGHPTGTPHWTSSVPQQLWAAAAAFQQQQQRRSDARPWQQSLSIGAGLGAVALGGAGSGGSAPPGSGGWGPGGGGSGWGHSHGGSGPGSNVLVDVAAAGAEVADAAVEDVILLDVGGGLETLNV